MHLLSDFLVSCKSLYSNLRDSVVHEVNEYIQMLPEVTRLSQKRRGNSIGGDRGVMKFDQHSGIEPGVRGLT